MRKFFCGISVFLFLCLLSFGYYRNYQIAERNNDGLFFLSVPYTVSPDKEKAEAAEVNSSGEAENTLYYLKDRNGYACIYKNDRKTIYEPTNIRTETLPEPLRSEVKKGKPLKDCGELYSFMENYSS